MTGIKKTLKNFLLHLWHICKKENKKVKPFKYIYGTFASSTVLRTLIKTTMFGHIQT